MASSSNGGADRGHLAIRDAIVTALRAHMMSSHPDDHETAEAVLDALRDLPVGDRMAAMGMEHVGWIDEHGQHWGLLMRNGVVEFDRRTYAASLEDRDHA